MAETEKITINLSVVDLGKIDLLVSEGFFSNRTDFIRAAVRGQLKSHEEEVKHSVIRNEYLVGVLVHTRKGLEKRLAKGQRMRIRVVGMVIFADDITPELADATIESVKVFGVFKANKGIKQVLGDRTKA